MKTILIVALVALAALLLLAIGAALAVLLAYGIGWLLARFLPFGQFEATLLSLIGVVSVGVVAYRLLVAIITGPLVAGDDDDEWEDMEDWDDEDEEDWEDDEDEEDDIIPSIPRWRQSRPKLDFSHVGRNDPCPCGSGKKFKHCHGSKT